jgi:hypothetical protein
MRKCINPIPSLDAQDISSKYYILFDFKDYVSKEDATNGINDFLKKNNGKITSDWLKAGEPVRFTPKFVNQDDVDPKYTGLTVFQRIRSMDARALSIELALGCPGLKDQYSIGNGEDILNWLNSKDGENND